MTNLKCRQKDHRQQELCVALFISCVMPSHLAGAALAGLIAKWSDENGVVNQTELPRPTCLSKYFRAATKIDDHDNVRQSKLDVEGSWRTQNPWFRLHCTFVGIVMTDLWKACDACGFLPPIASVDGRALPIKSFVNRFARRFFANDLHACVPRHFEALEKKAGSQQYKTSQYKKSPCYICKEKARVDGVVDAKIPRVSTYCQTCNPSGDRNFAICGEKSGRECWKFHVLRKQQATMQARMSMSMSMSPSYEM